MKDRHVVLVLASLFLLGGVIFIEGIVSSQTKNSVALVLQTISAHDLAFKNFTPRPVTSTMLFVGDVMLSRGVGVEISKHGNPRYPFLNIADTLRSADLAFANLEGPISDRGHNQGSIYSFRADPKTAEGLAYAGFDMMSVANNHIWDWGAPALLDSVRLLKENNICPVGAGANEEEANAPCVLRVGRATVGFLGYTTLYSKGLWAKGDRLGISRFELPYVEEQIKTLRGKVDVVIVSIHWGVEYRMHSTKEQENIAHALIDVGADLVLGHHPHVAEEVERYKAGWIAYSLGNFVFDQNFSKETTQGEMLRVMLKDKAIDEISTTTVFLSPTFQPSLSLNTL